MFAPWLSGCLNRLAAESPGVQGAGGGKVITRSAYDIDPHCRRVLASLDEAMFVKQYVFWENEQL